MNSYTIHRTSPAKDFEDGTPIGCGSAGAMLSGNTETEKIWLSHENIWSGDKIDTTEPDFSEKIAVLRQMYLDGNTENLDETAEKILKGSVHRIQSLEYAGLLTINLGKGKKTSDYRRDLHLNTGVADISFSKDGCKITQQAFSSYSYEVTCIKYTFSKPCDISVGIERENKISESFENGILKFTAKTQTGEHRFCVGVKINTDGVTGFTGSKATVKKATNVELFINISTEFDFDDTFEDVCLDILSECDDYGEISANHCEEFSALFERSDIHFDYDKALDEIPVDERLKRLKTDSKAEDSGLVNLYFAFGKYLLISSSREGTLPANLQGVWTEKLNNPWNADYHTNINLQMNYWLAEIANLGECHLPLFDYMNNFLLPSGKKTAGENYGCRGTVTHHLSDIYGFTAPADGLWGIWPMGGAWLATHMWEHYLFTLDEEFLKNEAYNYMKECALFFIDYLFEDKNGHLVSGPSMSPENLFYVDTKDGKKEAFLCFSPTMDTEIITEVLTNYIEAEKILKIDEDTAKTAEATVKRLPPLKVGKNGQLMEWQEDYDEPEPGHRHISHAFGLFPGKMINENTPEFFEAIKNTLDRRLKHGGGHTGWSRAWLINLFARLYDGKNAYEHIRLLLTASTFDSMLDRHPPFQIDGNFGGAAGIAETLLQSHNGYISLLPAVPDGLSGSFYGLKARGNIEIDAEFKNGRITVFSLNSDYDKDVKIKLNGIEALTDGENDIYPENGIFTVMTNADYSVIAK